MADTVLSMQTGSESSGMSAPIDRFASSNVSLTTLGTHEFTVAALAKPPAPILSVGLVNHEKAVVRGEVATFIGYSNYPGAIERSELRISEVASDPDGIPHYVAPFDANGAATWTPTSYAASDMQYVYRVYDSTGGFDETHPQPIEVLHAPGHTEGSVMFDIDALPDGLDAGEELTRTVVSGDVLFAGSIGRTDLPGGSAEAMTRSLREVVLPLPDSSLVLTGHGPATTLRRERATNPYLQGL